MKKFLLNSTLVVGVLVVFTSLVNHQQVSTDREAGIAALKKCSSLYFELKKFSIDVEYGVFYNGASFDQPAETEKGVLIRKNGNFYKEEFDNITLLNSAYVLKVDKQSEMIVVRKKIDSEGIPDQVSFDSLYNCIEKVEKIEQGYRYFLNLPQFSKMDVLFTSKGYLHTLRNYYRYPMDFGEGKVSVVTQIKYTNFKENPTIDAAFFSEKKYISIRSNGQVVPAEKYKNFEVLNYLDNP